MPGAFAYLARKIHGERADQFLGHVYSGDLPDSICSVLRDRYLKSRVAGSARNANLASQMGLALMIKAFNAHLRGTTINKFNLRMTDGEAYPQIVKA